MANQYTKTNESRIVTRIQDELEALTQIVRKMRVQFGKEVDEWAETGNFRSEMVKMGRELTTMVDSLLSLRIRFDKAQKELADNMSPEEERLAVIAYLKALTSQDRFILLQHVKAHFKRNGIEHEYLGTPGTTTGLEPGVQLVPGELEDEQVGGGDPEPPVLRDPEGSS